MTNALITAAVKAGKPHLKKGWTLQMDCLTATDYTVVIGVYDELTGREQGIRVTAELDRSVWVDGVRVTVNHF